MKTVFKIIGIVLAMLLLSGIMAYLAGFFHEKIATDSSRITPGSGSGQPLEVTIVSEPLIEQAAGTLRAKVEAVISPIITARISTITVWAGDEVKAGEVLVTLDARELEARVDQAHQSVAAVAAKLKQMEKEFARVKKIQREDPGAISRAEIERVQAAWSTAQAEVLRLERQEDEAKTALSYSELTAPIAGRIVERRGDPGDTAIQGEPLLRMYDPATLRLEADVRESLAARLSKKQPLTAEIDALGKQYPVRVDEIVPSADPGSRSFLVKASLPSGAGLYPGMFGRLMIPVGNIEKIYVPIEAVTRVGQLTYVIMSSKLGPVRRYVRLGGSDADGRVEVISGLRAGETILMHSD